MNSCQAKTIFTDPTLQRELKNEVSKRVTQKASSTGGSGDAMVAGYYEREGFGHSSP
jgi:hypothetical protein